jgi:DNA-directed RNA polymerase specialized sigma subunit
MGRARHSNTTRLDRESILIEFAPLIKDSVRIIRAHSKIPMDKEDLIAAALTGLFEAINTFDPKRGKSFQSFAESNIRQALMQEIRPQADFYKHILLQPVGAAEALHHMPDVTNGYDWKGHKLKTNYH